MESRELIGAQVVKLFSAFERGVSPERAARYTEALVRVPIDKLEAAVGWCIDHWEEKSPPTVAKLRQIAWRGTPNSPAQNEAEQERLKVLLYYMMRYSDADFYEFRRAFGFALTREHYGKLAETGRRMFGDEWKVPEGVTFTAPAPAWCKEQREQAMRAARDSFRRMGSKYAERAREQQTLPPDAEPPF
jgi:hypothetical protein